MTWFGTTMNRLRVRLLPSQLADHGWGPVWSLLYLGFLFMNWSQYRLDFWLPATLASVAVFLPMYFYAHGHCGWRRLATIAAIAALGFALAPFNTSSNTYLIYAGALLGSSGLGLRTSMSLVFAGLIAYAGELWLLSWPTQFVVLSVAITAIVATAIGAANHFHREKSLRQAELKLSHDEVRRLGALAERERIGRDLHDLLGHTLSLITLKSELAVKLFDRDPLAARREIVDVERVARDALGQVRRAVSGIRTAGLGAELASARLLLESSDIRLDYALAEAGLPVEIETVFALTVREAVTNIQRHAQATQARVEIVLDGDEARLLVSDNGIGSTIVPGNGLSGMRERLHLLGGHLEIESARGRGTRLIAGMPLPPVTAIAAPLHVPA
ncbi:MAG: sensor histidine kinase [Dokdonella sp.]|uniref:sensor histidine kinase n=1 Tax=Dokdonella sp. TaxID=2291710 RepID=UPI0032667653